MLSPVIGSLTPAALSAKLIIMRHGESTTNQTMQYAGWHDADLTAKGVEQARTAAASLRGAGYGAQMDGETSGSANPPAKRRNERGDGEGQLGFHRVSRHDEGRHLSLVVGVNFPHRRLLFWRSGRFGDGRRTTRVAGTGTADVAVVENMATPIRFHGSGARVHWRPNRGERRKPPIGNLQLLSSQ